MPITLSSQKKISNVNSYMKKEGRSRWKEEERGRKRREWGGGERERILEIDGHLKYVGSFWR
jgi:hypothetical protein